MKPTSVADSGAEKRARRVLKISDENRERKFGVVVTSFADLLSSVERRFPSFDHRLDRVVLDEDDTEVDNDDYFQTLPDNTLLRIIVGSSAFLLVNDCKSIRNHGFTMLRRIGAAASGECDHHLDADSDDDSVVVLPVEPKRIPLIDLTESITTLHVLNNLEWLTLRRYPVGWKKAYTLTCGWTYVFGTISSANAGTKTLAVDKTGNRWNGSVGGTGHWYVGAHVSSAGGLAAAVLNAVKIGATSFALFLRSQRQWNAKPMPDKEADEFIRLCKEHGFPSHLILPHGSYLLNLGSPSQETMEKSRALLLEEVQRCDRLGLSLYNMHPGSSCGKMKTEECLRLIAVGINNVLRQTANVKIVLENMSRQGHTVGGDFGELKAIIDMISDKSRIGVCIDTCHTFAAGYDLSTETGFKATLEEFDRVIGFQYLVACHINDSKGPLGGHKDRHENIGKGKLGMAPFQWLMNNPHFTDIPLILETPWHDDDDSVYHDEIGLLNSMIKK